MTKVFVETSSKEYTFANVRNGEFFKDGLVKDGDIFVKISDHNDNSINVSSPVNTGELVEFLSYDKVIPVKEVIIKI